MSNSRFLSAARCFKTAIYSLYTNKINPNAPYRFLIIDLFLCFCFNLLFFLSFFLFFQKFINIINITESFFFRINISGLCIKTKTKNQKYSFFETIIQIIHHLLSLQLFPHSFRFSCEKRGYCRGLGFLQVSFNRKGTHTLDKENVLTNNPRFVHP